MTWRTRSTCLILLAVLCSAGWAPVTETPATLRWQVFRSFDGGDYAAAAKLIEQYLQGTPHDPVMLFNASCAYSRLGERDTAASYLLKAVKAGFTDADHVLRDPDLEAIRTHPTYLAIVEGLQRAASHVANSSFEQWRNTYGDEHYRYEKDEQRRIAYATALDSTSHQEMRQMLQREADQLRRTLFDVVPKSLLLIAVPTPQDADRLFDDPRIGGMYEHAKRRLITRDIGGSLRHEFVHAMHYAHMQKLGQPHPLWVQEGLATLYEDYVLDDDGTIVFTANERHNIVKGRARAGRLTAWKNLFEMPDDVFMARASQLYPQVRSIFEFLADRGQLGCWYRALVEHFNDDPSGATAFEECFGMPVKDVERAWRRWLSARPAIDTTIDFGDAALGIGSAPNASNDGVLIRHIRPRSAARRAQLHVDDVIVSVDGRATRSLKELRAIIASKEVGDTVAIRARRDGQYFTVVVSLRPL